MEQDSNKEINSEKKNGGKHRYNNYNKKKHNRPAKKVGGADAAKSDAPSDGAGLKNDRPAKNNYGGKNDRRDNRGGRQGNNRPRGRGGRPTVHDNFDEIRTHGGNYVRYDYNDSDDGASEVSETEEYIVSQPVRGRGRRQDRGSEGTPGAVAGRNAVRELIRSGRSIDKIFVRSGEREGSIIVIVAEASSRGIPIVEVSSDKLDIMTGGSWHQGVVAMAAEKQYTDIEGILAVAKERGETPLIVIADGIEDPQNLGAMIRCAECAGAHGVIIPKRRAAGLTPAVTKASAGAIEHMAIAKVQNIPEAIEKLKKAGIWVFAAEAGGTPYYETDFKIPAAIVLGGEDSGVSRLVKEKSDFIVSIPMWGHVNSLNVSAAAAVILTHAARMQRS